MDWELSMLLRPPAQGSSGQKQVSTDSKVPLAPVTGRFQTDIWRARWADSSAPRNPGAFPLRAVASRLNWSRKHSEVRFTRSRFWRRSRAVAATARRDTAADAGARRIPNSAQSDCGRGSHPPSRRPAPDVLVPCIARFFRREVFIDAEEFVSDRRLHCWNLSRRGANCTD